ncbi:helix-turn-helix domain-containing protein [Actinomadura rugatobispora]|uniref:Helix-turn-helix domain-containing protein n=1 Tax=Actinomadura rugatobispora TaxID=1994 RepID=A0ABW1A3V0_9ACTN|nr:helix-turn-helix transcriptional regulator [Actinomadura rugatobispora]
MLRTMTPEQSPTVRHRRLARQLREARKRSGMSMEAAAAALGWSRPKLVRFETAKTRPTAADVAAMLDLYGGGEAIKLALVQLAKDIRKRGWWSAFNDVLAGSFAELEDDAVRIRTWQVQFVPGLLQISDYALALIRVSSPEETEEIHLRRLQARMARRTILERQEGASLAVVLDEAVLRRPVGGAEVMARQLDALVNEAKKTNVSLSVLPAASGEHAGMDGPFVILSFEGQLDPEVVYLEGMGGEIYVEDVGQVNRCNVRFDRLSDQALSEEDSARLIVDIAKEYRETP